MYFPICFPHSLPNFPEVSDRFPTISQCCGGDITISYYIPMMVISVISCIFPIFHRIFPSWDFLASNRRHASPVGLQGSFRQQQLPRMQRTNSDHPATTRGDTAHLTEKSTGGVRHRHGGIPLEWMVLIIKVMQVFKLPQKIRHKAANELFLNRRLFGRSKK